MTVLYQYLFKGTPDVTNITNKKFPYKYRSIKTDQTYNYNMHLSQEHLLKETDMKLEKVGHMKSNISRLLKLWQ